MKRAALLWLAAALGAQDTKPDFAADVTAACEHKKYGVRQAAAKKLADAGDAAVPAILARQKEHGRERIPQTLVEAIAGSAGTGEATVALLREWAEDRDFYWRAQALKGLANRRLAACEPLFRAAVGDPFHVYRVQGARGLRLVGARDRNDAAGKLLNDEDPRARVAFAAVLLGDGDDEAARVLKEALERAGDEFLGDPWAMRDAQLAVAALKQRWPDREWPIANPAELPGSKDAAALTCGLEVRSCRNGDFFLRWSPGGSLVAGLRGGTPVGIAHEAWQRLGEPPFAGKPQAVHGEVICDYLQLVWHVPAGKAETTAWRQKFAPAALTRPLAAWLQELAAALDATDAGRPIAAALRSRLSQFAAPANR